MRRAEDGSTASRIVTAGVLFVGALLARITSLPLVFRQDGVQPAGSDAFYHLRRIGYAVENFPQFLFRDPYLNFPHGGEAIWSPAFDASLALLGWSLVGPGDQASLERLLVWVPPLVGAATVVFWYLIVSRTFSRGVGLLAAGLLAVLPAHVAYSRIGAIDHHVAVAFCFAWMLFATLRTIERSSQSHGLLDLRAAAGLGVSLGASILVWPGMLLHVLVVQIALGVACIAPTERRSAYAAAFTVAAAHALAAAITAPLSVGRTWEVWGSFSPVVATSFQPVYLLAAGTGFAALACVFRFGPYGDTFAKRAGQAIAVAAIALLVAFLAIPSLWEAWREATGWFAKRETFQASVAESAPLFSRGSGIETGRAELLLSRAIYVVPIAIAGFALRLRSAANPAALATILWATTALLLATLLQRRFMNSYSIVHATILALAVAWALSTVQQRMPARLVFARIGVAIVAAILAWPMLGWYSNDFQNLGRLQRGEPVRAVGTELIHETLLSVAHWLRRNSQPTSGFFDVREAPEYGVLSAWGDGHLLLYAARRPTVQSNFGDDVGAENFEAAEAFYASRDESEALAILDRLRARYVVVGRMGSGHSPGYGTGTLFTRLYPGVREASAGTQPASISPVVSLTGLRLVHTSRRPPASSPRFPFYAVYERVAGARVEGRAAPGATVRAQLKLLTDQNGGLRFVSEVRADRQGRYRLRLPYANDRSASTLRRGASYRITSGGSRGRVTVADADVRSGALLAGPDFE